jgi:hypothetical protein
VLIQLPVLEVEAAEVIGFMVVQHLRVAVAVAV